MPAPQSMVFGCDPIQYRVKWRVQGERGQWKQSMQSQGGKYSYFHVLRSKVTTDACAPVVNFKGGLDTLDDPECNLGDHIYYYFVPDWPDMDVTRSCGWGLRAEFSVRTIGEADDRSVGVGRSVIYLVRGGGNNTSGLTLGIGHDPLPPPLPQQIHQCTY